MKFFDAHTHVQFAAFKDEEEAAIARALASGVGMNIVGTQFNTSAAAVSLAEKFPDTYASIGLHPIHTAKSFHDAKELGEGGAAFTSRGEIFDAARYEALAASPKVIAVGECGLDYYRLEAETKKIQEEAFVAQIELANKLSKPLMLHIRDAYDDALALIKAHARVRGDVHFFAGEWEVAKKFIDLGFTLSFTGVITFTNDYDEIVANTPIDMLLTETDAPYVSPVPHRGQRNEPAYVAEVVKKMAALKGLPAEDMAARTVENAKRVFGIA